MCKEVYKKDSEALRDFLDSLPKSRYSEVITKIAEGCMTQRYTIFNWKRGLCRIPELHKCKIEEIIGEKIFSRLNP